MKVNLNTLLTIMIHTFWKGTLISKFYEVSDDELMKLGSQLVEQGVRRGTPIKTQVKVYTSFLDNLKDRKTKKKPIRRTDHTFGLHSLCALVKLKIISLDDDLDGILNQKKRRKSLSKRTNPVEELSLDSS